MPSYRLALPIIVRGQNNLVGDGSSSQKLLYNGFASRDRRKGGFVRLRVQAPYTGNFHKMTPARNTRVQRQMLCKGTAFGRRFHNNKRRHCLYLLFIEV
jgi:hypothetical protein